MSARHVVLISLGAAAPGDALLAGVRRLRDHGTRVTLVSRVSPAPTLAAVLDEHRSIGQPVGGPLRIGKLRLDPHRLPGALAAVLSPRSGPLLRQADALVAVDAAALPAVWLAARVNRRALAVRGLPAALARIP